MSFKDHRAHEYRETRGPLAFLERLRIGSGSPLGGFAASGRIDEIEVDMAAEWHGDRGCHLEGYANLERTSSGGTHVRGLMAGLVRGLREVAGNRCAGVPRRRVREAISRGLNAVVCVRLRDPAYAQPTKDRLRVATRP